MIVKADDDRNLRELLALLGRIQQWRDLVKAPSEAWTVQPGSALAGDDSKTDPYHVSHSAWHALTVAVDHLECLRSSLVSELKEDNSPILIHTHAQSSLIRGAIENGCRAVWMLGPSKRLTRITRRLSLEAAEMRHSYRIRELVGQPARRTKEEREEQLRQLLITAGIPADETKKALRSPQYGDIVREAGELTEVGADVTEVVWSGCSSLVHGDLSGTLGMLDKEIVTRTGNVAYARITGSISGLYWTTVAAVMMIDRGFDLYRCRATKLY